MKNTAMTKIHKLTYLLIFEKEILKMPSHYFDWKIIQIAKGVLNIKAEISRSSMKFHFFFKINELELILNVNKSFFNF